MRLVQGLHEGYSALEGLYRGTGDKVDMEGKSKASTKAAGFLVDEVPSWGWG